MRYHSTSTRKLKPKRLKMPNAGKDVEPLESSHTVGGCVNHYRHVGIQRNHFNDSISRNILNRNARIGLPRDGCKNDHS